MEKYKIRNYHTNLFCANNNGTLPIHIAASMGNVRFVNLLLEKDNLLVEAKDEQGLTSLDLAKKSLEEYPKDQKLQDMVGILQKAVDEREATRRANIDALKNDLMDIYDHAFGIEK